MNQLRVGLRLATLMVVATLAAACASTTSMPPKQPTPGSDLSGEWVLTTQSQVGTEDALMTVRQTGNKLTGTIAGRAGTVDYTGSVQGAAVEFDFVIRLHGENLQLDYSGAIEGDTMQGRAVFGQFGEGTFIAKRK